MVRWIIKLRLQNRTPPRIKYENGRLFIKIPLNRCAHHKPLRCYIYRYWNFYDESFNKSAKGDSKRKVSRGIKQFRTETCQNRTAECKNYVSPNGNTHFVENANWTEKTGRVLNDSKIQPRTREIIPYRVVYARSKSENQTSFSMIATQLPNSFAV